MTLSHDSYHCAKYRRSDMEVRPFPTRRNTSEEAVCNFVGAPCDRGGSLQDRIHTDTKESICPVECRKEEDWTFC